MAHHPVCTACSKKETMSSKFWHCNQYNKDCDVACKTCIFCKKYDLKRKGYLTSKNPLTHKGKL
jgi:hypothetical protein